MRLIPALACLDLWGRWGPFPVAIFRAETQLHYSKEAKEHLSQLHYFLSFQKLEQKPLYYMDSNGQTQSLQTRSRSSGLEDRLSEEHPTFTPNRPYESVLEKLYMSLYQLTSLPVGPSPQKRQESAELHRSFWHVSMES